MYEGDYIRRVRNLPPLQAKDIFDEVRQDMLAFTREAASRNVVANQVSDGDSDQRVTEENAPFLAFWCGGTWITEIDPFDSEKRYRAVNVPTANGVERASRGDTIVKHENGTFGVQKGEFR